MTTDLLDKLRDALAERYQVKREIGRGGMATVYLADDLKHAREVAIKVLRQEVSAVCCEPDRFLLEIKIAAGLTHPRILPLYDSGECDGLLYYIMPYVGGETLRDRIRLEKRLPMADAIRITRAVATGLDYAHGRGVLHRDIKPENILLSEGQPVVADFGIARAITEASSENLTDAGFAIGTPTYMSPEQASADPDIDGRADLYSLACVFYEMVTGDPPFVGSSSVQTVALHATQAVPPLRIKRPDVPIHVEQAVERALAKQPADRFATVGEFGNALADGGALGKVSGIGSGGSGTVAIAVLPFVNTSADKDNEYFSDGMTDELISALANVGGLRVTSRTSVFALKGTRKDIREIGTMLNVAVVLEGSVRKAGERIRITSQLTNVADGNNLWSGRYDREIEDVFAVQDEIAGTIVSTLRTTLLGNLSDPVPRRYTESVQAYRLYLKGRFHWNRRSGEGIGEGIKYFEQAIEEDPNYALAHTGLADSYALQFDYRGLPVAEGMERAKVEARRALELDESLAEAHTSLAWVTFIYDWDWVAAGRGFRRAIELNPRYATARQWHSWFLIAMGRFDEALAEGRAAMALDPVSISIRRALGWLSYYARRYEAALEPLRQVVVLDPTSEENQRMLGLALMQTGRLDEAATAYEEAIALSSHSAYAIAGRAHLATLRGDWDKARELLDDLHEQAKGRYISPVAFVIIYVALGEQDRAVEWLTRAYEERRGWLAYLKVEPMLDPLRDDARFKRLLQLMKLD